MEPALQTLSVRVGEALTRRGITLATAESCTGGWVAQVVTATAGSSGWFDRGFVVYTNEAKVDMLGVAEETLARFGAVSEETAREMALGALRHSKAQAALAITGIAGPSGSTPDKPVGTVCFAWALANSDCLVHSRRFAGDREQVRRQSVEHALHILLERLDASAHSQPSADPS